METEVNKGNEVKKAAIFGRINRMCRMKTGESGL
jgi:hypothetical protein